MASPVYRFGGFRLDSAARELWRGSELLELQRLTFDGLTFLVEHRDRAVSRDELIHAVWEKPFVEDIQVTHLVMRVRRALDDDSHEPRFIRTIPGFGYRWIAETEESPVEEPAVAAAAPRIPWLRRWWVLAPLAAVAVAVLTHAYIRHDRAATRLPRQPGEAVAVLPLDVHAPRGADSAWMRLGGMDLIAERLREAGLAVPPSDSVVFALHTAAELPEPARLPKLRRTLHAGILVRGRAARRAGEWRVTLTAVAAGGERRRVESDGSEIVVAVRRATDLLIAALGHAAPSAAGGDSDAISEVLQRARAAALALELDAARSILSQAPPRLRSEPVLRLELAWIEFRAGKRDVATAVADELLQQAAVRESPRLSAEALMVRGVSAVFQQGHWAIGEPDFDGAVTALRDELWAAELGRALAMRGMARLARNDLDAAARDLGWARTQFEVSGDRLGLARCDSYFGNLELQRNRPTDALPYFESAIAVAEAFGHVDWTRANLLGLLLGQMRLLRWPDALATSEQVWDLRARIQDPAAFHDLAVARANVLIAAGRLREAEAILTDLRGRAVERMPAVALHGERMRAKLAWQRGHPGPALDAAARALELWSVSKSPLWFISRDPMAWPPMDAALLLQRASIAAGEVRSGADAFLAAAAVPAGPVPEMASRVAEASEESVVADHAGFLVVQAEWAAYRGNDGEAERLFRRAVAQAEAWAVPDILVLVADAYARWLLARDRIADSVAVAGRVAGWAEHDFDSALLQVAVLHASGRRDAWAAALRRARDLAGERELPDSLLRPPA